MRKYFLLLLSLLISCAYLQGQDLDVTINIPTVGEDRFSVCAGEKDVNITVRNTGGGPISGMTMAIDLSAVEGIVYTGSIAVIQGGAVTFDTGSTIDAPAFNLPDLADNETSEFTLGLEALCEAVALSGSGATPNFTLNFNYTGGTGSESYQSPNFEVVKPALTISQIEGNPLPLPLVKNGTSASVFDGVLGQTDTLRVTTVNGGNGSLDSFIYWVIDHPLLTLNEVRAGTHILPFIGQSNDTLFYRVDQTAINRAVPDITSPPNDNNLFQFNESITFTEEWTTDLCSTNFPDLERGVAYGCAGSPTAICEETGRTSGLRFGFLRPVLTASTGWAQLNSTERLEGLPACYNDDVVKQRVWIHNSGAADAHNVNFSLTSWPVGQNAKILLANNTTVSIGQNGTPMPLLPDNTYTIDINQGDCSFTDEIVSADYQLSDINLLIPPGDTLWITFEMDYLQCGCDNGTSRCSMENWYFGVLNWGSLAWARQANYTDPCNLNTYTINQVNTVDWYSRLGTIQEMPASVADNQVVSSSFTTNNSLNTWLQDYLNSSRTRYQDGVYRMYFHLAEGLDYNGTAGDLLTADLTWTLLNGDIWLPSNIEYTDNNGGPDTVFAEFAFADFPGSYSGRFGNGMKLNLNVVGDCGETGPVCMQGNDMASVGSEFFFAIDSNCTDCGDGNYVDCIKSTPIELDCPPCGPCDGLTPISLTAERQNFERPDNDNNLRPDPTGSIDKTRVAVNRAISGDTIKFTYRGYINTSTTPGRTFPGAFSLIQLPVGENLSFLPQGGNLTITKAGGTQYTASVLQQFPEGNQIITNLSPANLNALGNAVPANLLYEENDTIEIEVLLRIEDPDFLSQDEANNFRDVTVSDLSFISDETEWATAQNDRYACDNIEERFYYIEQLHRTDQWYSDNLGACSPIRTGEYQRWAIGGLSLDYFPFEFRTPKGYLETTVLYKAPGLEIDRVLWRIANKGNSSGIVPVGQVPLQNGAVYGTLESPIAASATLQTEGQIPLSSPYLSVSGDQITIYSGQFFRDNFPDLEADEGFVSAFALQMKADCGSEPVGFNVPGEGQIIPQNQWTTDPKVFGYSSLSGGRIATAPSEPIDMVNSILYGYQGGPELLLQVPVTNNQIQGEVGCFQAEVVNASDYDADFAFFSVENLSGGVIIETVSDITDVGNPILLTESIGGIYPIGDIPGGGAQPTTKLLEVCVRSNNCERDSLLFNVGWDCDEYPPSPQESTCAEPDTVYVVPTEAELGMVIREPETTLLVDLCDNQEYYIELSSAKAGHLNDIELSFTLPKGQEYELGSFEYAWPVTSPDHLAATYVNPGIDPDNIYGDVYQINISSLDPTLNTTGMPGTLQPGQNLMFVRFNTTTECGYTSGGRARFLSQARNNCGERTNLRYSPASAIGISGLSDFFQTQLDISDADLNPCLGDDLDVNISFRLRQNSQNTAGNDSIMVILPPGLTYETNSLVVLQNGVNVEPGIELDNGQQTLLWPVQTGLAGGEQISFSFTANSMDVGQGCYPYQLVVATFNSQETFCATPAPGQTCNIRAVSDEAEATINFVKPDLQITAFDGHLTFLAPNQEELDYTLSLFNSGASIPNGSTTVVQIVADLDDDGNFSAGDQVLNTVSTNASIPANGEYTFSGSVPLEVGLTCDLIAVINPEATCACEVNPSFRLNPSLDLVFDKSPSVCSDVPLNIGPEPVAVYSYDWIALNGSNIAAISPTNSSPATFRQVNVTGGDLIAEYALRITRNGTCFAYDTMQVRVYPEENSTAAFDACESASFSLPGPDSGSNFVWMPAANLDDPNIASPTASGLTAPEIFTLNYTDANGCAALKTIDANIISCADTGLGDTLWWDINYDGIQDPGEPGVPGVTIWLVNPADPTSPIQTTTTDADGAFFFSPLTAGDYQVRFIPTDEMTFTLANAGGDDTLDSDADVLTGYTPDRFVFNGLQDSTFDAGIIYIDYGDLPDASAGTAYLDYQTTEANGAPSHIIIPGLQIGTSVDGEQDGQPESEALGDDANDAYDDEDGIGITNGTTWRPGETINLSINTTNTTGQTSYLRGWIDWNGDGDFDEGDEQVTDLSGGSLSTLSTFTVPSDIPPGRQIGVRYRLSLDAAMTETGQVNSGEIEDYLITIACPNITEPLSSGDVESCSSEALPTVSATPPAGMLVDWYANPTGGTPLLSGSNTFTPSSFGTYYAETREPLNGCVSTGRTAVTLSQSQLPTVTSFSTSSDVTCGDNPTISANTNPTGGTFSWTGPSIVGTDDTPSITVDASGRYYLTYTAPNGCSVIDSTEVAENFDTPGADAGAAAEIDCGTSTITLSGSNTVAGSTYNWTTTDGTIDSGAATENPVVSAPGTYTLTTTHPVSACTSTDDVLITQSADLAASSTSVPQRDCDSPDGSIDVTITAGAAPISFSWSNGATTEDLSGLGVGTYTVTITDANNCEAVLSETITDEAPIITLTPNVACEATGSNYNLTVQIDYTFSQGSNVTVTLGTGESQMTTLPVGTGTTTLDFLGLSNIGSTNIAVDLNYANDSGCDVSATYDAPAICCQINNPIITTYCEDNDTPNRPEDDLWFYTINPQGTGTGATVNITGDDPRSGLAFNTEHGPFGPFNIADGDLTLTITDSSNPGCSLLDFVVPAPATCSDAEMDYGDLPSSYGTSEEEDGPRHVVVPGLNLGNSIDSEDNGTPDTDASYDGADEDGLGMTNQTQFAPNATVNIPLSVTNTTGVTSYADAWIDWNGDGDFDDPGEYVADLTDVDGTQPYPSFIPVVVPGDVAQDVPLGVRIRLSYDDNLTPNGLSYSGEVEDYIIRASCRMVCPPVQLNIRRD